MLETDKWEVYGDGIFYLGLFQLINKEKAEKANPKPVTYWSDQLLPFNCTYRRNSLNRWLRVNNKGNLEVIDPEKGLVFPISTENVREVENWGKCVVDDEGVMMPRPYNFTDRPYVRIDRTMARRPVTSTALTVIRIDLNSQDTVIVDWRTRSVLPKLN